MKYLASAILLLVIGLPLFSPKPVLAALECTQNPAATQCLCYFPDDIAEINDLETDLDCQFACDELDGATSYQFNECVDGEPTLGNTNSLDTRAADSCSLPENNICTCQYPNATSSQGEITTDIPVRSEAECRQNCTSRSNVFGSATMHEFTCKVADKICDPSKSVCTCSISDRGVEGAANTVTKENIATETACRTACTSNVTSYQSFACDVAGPVGTLVPKKEPIIPNLNVQIPGLDFKNSLFQDPNTGNLTSNLLALYIQAVYRFLLVAMSIIAVVMLMLGGLEYTISGGSAKRVEKAKTRIRNAVVGLILLFAAYDIAFLLDPRTVMFSALQIPIIQGVANDNRSLVNTPPGTQTKLDPFKAAACPTKDELLKGVTFFITSYYAPEYNVPIPGFQSFECNIAMQCSCPAGGGRGDAPQAAKTCFSKGLNYSWEPCVPFGPEVTYCDKTTYFKELAKAGKVGTPPVGYHTAAVSDCLKPFGNRFKVFGAPDPASNAATWVAEDTGGEIKGRRVDLFLGKGQAAYDKAKMNLGEVTIRLCPDTGACPTTLN